MTQPGATFVGKIIIQFIFQNMKNENILKRPTLFMDRQKVGAGREG
jgi:hypothetical protein